MNKFFSVVMAVILAVVGFAAWPAAITANDAVITFGQPIIGVSSDVRATLTDQFTYNNFRKYTFTLKNNSSDPTYISTGFGNDMASWSGDYNPVEYQWWTLLLSPTGERTTNNQKFRLEPRSEYTLSLTVEILLVRGNATVFPFVTQTPRLNDVAFQMSEGVVYVSWRSSGNWSGEPVRIGIWRTPNTLTHSADIPDGGSHSVDIESWPEGEYYITQGFLSSGQIVYSPLYYSPGLKR